MEYKDILAKIKSEIPKQDQQKAIREAASAMNGGTDPSVVWSDILEKYSPEKSAAQSAAKNPEKTKKRPAAPVPGPDQVDSPEIVQGEAINEDDYINGLYLPEIYDKINRCIKDFCMENEIDGIQGLKKSRQSTWAALCTYIGVHIFKGSKLLKSNRIFDNGSAIPSNCAAYDIEKVVAILRYCDYLCQKYDKVFTFWSACDFCGVDEAFITDHAEKLTSAGFPVYKKTENSINNSILDGRTNPTGAIATLNYRFKWSQPMQQAPIQNITVVAYPTLGGSASAAALDDKKGRV